MWAHLRKSKSHPQWSLRIGRLVFDLNPRLDRRRGPTVNANTNGLVNTGARSRRGSIHHCGCADLEGGASTRHVKPLGLRPDLNGRCPQSPLRAQHRCPCRNPGIACKTLIPLHQRSILTGQVEWFRLASGRSPRSDMNGEGLTGDSRAGLTPWNEVVCIDIIIFAAEVGGDRARCGLMNGESCSRLRTAFGGDRYLPREILEGIEK